MNRLLYIFHYSLIRWLRFYLRNSKLVLLSHLLLYCVLFGFIFTLKPDFTLSGFLNTSVSEDTANFESLVIAFKPKNGFLDKRSFCDFIQWKSDLTLDFYQKTSYLIYGPTEIKQPLIENDQLTLNRLVDNNCYNINFNESVDYSLLDKSPWGPVYLSHKKDDILISIEVPPATHQSWSVINNSLVGDILSSISSHKLEDKFNIYFLGKPFYEFFTLDGLKQILLLNLLYTVILIVLFRFFFGTFKSGLIATIPFTFAAVILHGLMGIFHQPLNILMSIVYLIMTLAALQDFLFVSFNQMKSKIWIGHFTRYLIPCFFTSFTTVIGFGSLGTSNLEIIRQFGFWAALGTAIEWYTIFYLLPCLIKEFKSLSTWVSVKSEFRVQFLDKLSSAHISKFFVIPFIMMIVLGLILIDKININDSPENAFPNDHILHQSADYFMNTRGWKGRFHLIFTDSQAKNENMKIIEDIQRIDQVQWFENPYHVRDFLLSNKDPQLNQVIYSLIKEDPAFDRMFNDQGKKITASIYIKNSDLKSLIQLKSQIINRCGPHCYPQGELIDYLEFANEAPKTLIDSLKMSVVLVLLVMVFLALGTNQSSYIIPLCLSTLWGVLCAIVLISVMKVEINFLTSIFSSILVGFTGDNAIQFLLSSRKKSLNDNISHAGGGAIITATIMCVCSMSFIFSYFAPVRVLGILLSFGLLAALIGDLWGLRLLIGYFRRKIS